MDLEAEYELDSAEDLRLQVQGIVENKQSSCGYFGFTPGLVSPGKHRTKISLSVNGFLAPPRFRTTELEFSFYRPQGAPVSYFRFPYIKNWAKKVFPGGTEPKEKIGNFALRDRKGKLRSFKNIAGGRPAVIYGIQPWGDYADRERAKLEPLMKELEASGAAVIGLYYLGGTAVACAPKEPANMFGEILMDPTGIANHTYRLEGSNVMVVDESGTIVYKGPGAANSEAVLGALGLGIGAWPYQPKKRSRKK